MPVKSKSLKFKLMAIGLCPPWEMSIRLIRNGSNGGIDKPWWPFGCCCTILVMTRGRHSKSAGLHCGISVAKIENKTQYKYINQVTETTC